MVNNALFTSNSDEWATPQAVFDELDAEFNFNLDPCATEENHKTALFFTQNDNGLSKNWGGIACFVTRLIAILRLGLKRHITRQQKTIHLLFY